MMKRKSRSNSEAMDFMEFNKDATKLLREVQCLQGRGSCGTEQMATDSEHDRCHLPHGGHLLWDAGSLTWSL